MSTYDTTIIETTAAAVEDATEESGSPAEENKPEEARPKVNESPYQFTVDRKGLLKSLKTVVRVIPNKTTTPILGNVRIAAYGGCLLLTTTDPECGYLDMICGVQVDREGQSTLPARDLIKYLEGLQCDAVTMEGTPDESTRITAGSARFRMPGMSVDQFPELPSGGEQVAILDAATIRHLIERTNYAISSEESRFTTNGALWNFTGQELQVVATDGHRMAFQSIPLEREPMRFLVPTAGMEELLYLAKQKDCQPFVISQDENHLYFQTDKRRILCRKLKGNFPDYERVLIKEGWGVTVVNSEDLRQVLAQAKKFADVRSQAIRLAIGPEMKVHANGTESGEFEAPVPIVGHVGKELTMGFNVNYILEFLAAAKGKPVGILTQNENSAAEFQIAGEAGFRMVVMPMRI